MRSFSLFLMAACLAVFTVGCPSDVVFVPDTALDSAIRAEISKPLGMLTRTDMLGVQSLDARGLGIRNLSGIEYCSNLRWLDLDTNEISDLTPLEQLGRPEDPFSSPLVYLNLDDNQISDITPLAGMLNLQGLSLFNNQIADISPLVTNAKNGGLGEGDYIILDLSTLDEEAQNVDLPTLQDLGVRVYAVVPADTDTE